MSRKPSLDARKSFSFSELDFSRNGSPAIVQWVAQIETEAHRHDDFLEIVLASGGEGVHEADGARCSKLRPGSFFIIDEGCRHRYSACEKLELTNILVRRDFAKPLLKSLREVDGFAEAVSSGEDFKEPGALSQDALASCLNLARRVEAETWSADSGRDRMIAALLSELLITLFRAAAKKKPQASSPCPAFGKLAEYIESHVSRDDATLEAMAKAAGLSERTLLRKFKERTGLTPMEFLNALKFAKARRLLSESSLEIKVVAARCGFKDGSYFTRQWKLRFGSTPVNFRKRLSVRCAIRRH